jgi:hypothetical protein
MMEVCKVYASCPGAITDVSPNKYSFDLYEDDYDCMDFLTDLALEQAQAAYQQHIDELKAEFIENYLHEAIYSVVENFKMIKPDNEYNYTLYYYDQAGNLVRTVPPKGVNRMDQSAGNWGSLHTDIKNARMNYDAQTGYVSNVLPNHELVTSYAFNALDQLVWQHTPDGGESYFWYDALGRIVASQNAKQEPNHLYAYTKFDELGRTIEVGELQGAAADKTNNELQVDVDDVSYPDNWTMNRHEVTRTIYDENLELPTVNPLYFRNRIGSVIRQENLDDNTVYRSAYHYQYDVHGNVEWMQQDFRTNVEIPNSGLSSTTEYKYDLISGNVLEVTYKTPSEKDLMIHRYFYDADNRLIDVETSRDNYFWNNDAHYVYYDHGPLARVEIGNDKVQ